MGQMTGKCEKCKKIFLLQNDDEKICPYCGHRHIRIIDIAF